MRPVFHDLAGLSLPDGNALPVAWRALCILFPILPCASCGDAQENESQQTT